MNVKKINHFLQDVAAHNNREWFQEHKVEYLAAKSDFEEGITARSRFVVATIFM